MQSNPQSPDSQIPSGETSATHDGHGGLRLHPAISLLLAILAGAAAVGVYVAAFPVYEVPLDLMSATDMQMSEEAKAARQVAFNEARMTHATLALGALGLLLGGMLGAGEAATRRLGAGVVVRWVAGALVGGVLGGLGGLLGSTLWMRLVPTSAMSSMGGTMVAQLCMLGLLGLGVGSALGLVAGQLRTLSSCAVTGLAAGVLAAFLYPVAFGMLLPHINTDVVIPDGYGGIFGCVGQPGLIGLSGWIGFPAIAIGLLLPLVNRRKTPATT